MSPEVVVLTKSLAEATVYELITLSTSSNMCGFLVATAGVSGWPTLDSLASSSSSRSLPAYMHVVMAEH
jgi:hypothetical protein